MEVKLKNEILRKMLEHIAPQEKEKSPVLSGM